MYPDIEECETTWCELDYEKRLQVAVFLGKALVDHAMDGGTYRYLIYERLGFDCDAYGYLLDYYMTISNEFIISRSKTKQNELAEKFQKYLETQEFNSEKKEDMELRYMLYDVLFNIKDLYEQNQKLSERLKEIGEQQNV